MQQLGINLTNLNYLSILFLLIALTTIAILLFELKYTPTLASVFLLRACLCNACKQGLLTSICFMVNAACSYRTHPHQRSARFLGMAGDRADLSRSDLATHRTGHRCKVWPRPNPVRDPDPAPNRGHHLPDGDPGPPGAQGPKYAQQTARFTV
jgi:hypothetical protein